MKNPTRHLAALACASWLAACSGGWGGAQTQQVDGFTLALKTDPAPLQVGRTAELKLRLTGADAAAAEGCAVTFRQYMPGMDMSSDRVVVVMQPQGAGVYASSGSEYSMGGDWQIEVKFTCAGQERTALFDYTLEWPE